MQQTGLSVEEVENHLARCAGLKASDIELLFSDLPDSDKRHQNRVEIEKGMEKGQSKFAELRVGLPDSNQFGGMFRSLWTERYAQLGWVHFGAVLEPGPVIQVTQIVEADILDAEPTIENEQRLLRALQLIALEIQNNPSVGIGWTKSCSSGMAVGK
jgi:hypothetical protein